MIKPHLIIVYKNFSKECNISHIGMGVTAAYTAKTLSQNGYFAEARPMHGADDLTTYLEEQDLGTRPVTHVVICAQWIPAKNLALMARQFPYIKFAVNCHSNVGFLQAEPNAIKLVRDAIDLETQLPNFYASSNNARLVRALQNMYGRPVTYLPNLYNTTGQEFMFRPSFGGSGVLKIGAFGSHRIYKNFSTAIAASIELINQLKIHGEIWINSGRTDGAGSVVYNTAVAWTRGLPNVTLKEFPWASWPEFKRQVGAMDLLMQPSYTETFNNVTADGICEGVPSVVGSSIEWVPDYWKADVDNSSNVADVGRRLLANPLAARDGLEALKQYVKNGLPYWQEFLRGAV